MKLNQTLLCQSQNLKVEVSMTRKMAKFRPHISQSRAHVVSLHLRATSFMDQRADQESVGQSRIIPNAK